MAETHKTELTRADVTNVCWQACDTFRGVIDASQYKDYILVMLFYKYMSDVWHEHREAYMHQYDNNVERVDRVMSRERFILPEGYGFDDIYASRHKENIGELIDIAIDQIEVANRPKLNGVFQEISFNTDQLGTVKDCNRLLKTLLEDFSKLDLSPARIKEDMIGEAYMFLIERFGSDAGKKAGEFYTPASVRKLVALLAKPEPEI